MNVAETPPTPPSTTTPLATGGILHYEGDASGEQHSDVVSGGYESKYDETLSGLHFSADYLLMGGYPVTPSVSDVPKSNWPGDLTNNQNPAIAWSSSAASDASTEYHSGPDGSDQTVCAGTEQFGQPSITFGDRAPGLNRPSDAISGIPSYPGPTLTGTCHFTSSTSDYTYDGLNGFLGNQMPAAVNPADNYFTFPQQPWQGTSSPTQQVTVTVQPSSDVTVTSSGAMTLTCALCVSDIRFRQLLDPTDGSDQLQDVPSSTTVDGNVVEISAQVHNTTNRDFSVPVTFADTKLGRLPEAQGTKLLQPVSFPAGSTTTVTEDIDTSGLAWSGGGNYSTPTLEHTIVVATPFGAAERQLDVLPKPVVLVHGWFSSAATWETEEGFLRAKDPYWTLAAVGDGQAPGVMDTSPVYGGNSIEQNATIEGNYIEGIRQQTGAQHVDLLVHSMGGLISRDYIDHIMTTKAHPPGGRPLVAHLVMMGTPNQGSDCAIPASVLALLALGNAAPTIQLRSDYITKVFNPAITHQHGVKFSVDAGTGYPVCGPADGDGVVTQTSAWYTYSDVGTLPDDLHTQLITDPAGVDQWIIPHLALGRFDYLQAQPTTAASMTASTTTSKTPVGSQVVLATHKSLAAGATTTVKVPVPAASALDITAITPPSVAITVKKPNGQTARAQKADSPAASLGLRMLRFGKPATGTWKVILHNSSATVGASVAVGASLDGTSARVTPSAKVTSTHHLIVSASFRKGTSPIKGATVTAVFRPDRGSMSSITLRDNGLGQDAKRGDGIYTGTSATVPSMPRRHGVLILVRGVLKTLSRYSSTVAAVAAG